MDDAVARFRAATEENDIAELMSTLTPEVKLVSPISGRMVFRGEGDARILLSAVYATLRGLRWSSEVGDEHTRVVVGECYIGPLRLGDAMVLELAEDGRIHTIRPHLRPWLALTLFALLLGPKIARHPGVLWRALQPD